MMYYAIMVIHRGKNDREEVFLARSKHDYTIKWQSLPPSVSRVDEYMLTHEHKSCQTWEVTNHDSVSREKAIAAGEEQGPSADQARVHTEGG